MRGREEKWEYREGVRGVVIGDKRKCGSLSAVILCDIRFNPLFFAFFVEDSIFNVEFIKVCIERKGNREEADSS